MTLLSENFRVPASTVVGHIAIGAGGLGFQFPGLSNKTKCRLRLATAAMFLWSCVTQALSCGDGPLVIRFSVIPRV